MKNILKNSKQAFTMILVISLLLVVPYHLSKKSTAPIVVKNPSNNTKLANSSAEGDDSAPSTSAAQSKSVNLTNNAPKQNSIAKKVAVEYVYHALIAPNDPYYVSSWDLQKVNTSGAWDISTGSGDTVVAVIDTGFALNHEDLSASWKTNSGETGVTQTGDRCWTGSTQSKQTNTCDDDNNGYVDDWRGWNFSAATNFPQAGQVNSSAGAATHGSEVAGLVGAQGNNGTGIATINWNTKVMPLQALDDNGTGYTSDIAAAIYYAVDNGASVINMSLGGDTFDQALSDAILYAYNHNVVVIAAAGNCGTGTESGCDPAKPGALSYPATENHVISVGATNQSDLRASFSSNGQGLDVVAPGSGSMISTAWTSSNQTTAYVGSLFGTSFAAPQVASLASLVKAIRPSTSVDDVTALLLGGANKLSAMNGKVYTTEYGHGMINATTALTIASSLNAMSSPPVPVMAQTGGYASERQYTTSEALSSGCQVQAGSYCTIWAKEARTGYDRYLPYTVANGSGQAGWSWTGSVLGAGEWNIRALQGQTVSTTPYQLLFK